MATRCPAVALLAFGAAGAHAHTMGNPCWFTGAAWPHCGDEFDPGRARGKHAHAVAGGDVAALTDTAGAQLSEETFTCINHKIKSMTVQSVNDTLKGLDSSEEPAEVCAAVPGPGFYHGFQGMSNFAPSVSPAEALADSGRQLLRGLRPSGSGHQRGREIGDITNGVTWLGKFLKNCTDLQDAGCQARALSNKLLWPEHSADPYESYFGTWAAKQSSWLDGRPAATIVYPDDMPAATDELRPWCACGVRVFLGALIWTQDSWTWTMQPYKFEDAIRGFILVPPTAIEGDCAIRKASSTMCEA